MGALRLGRLNSSPTGSARSLLGAPTEAMLEALGWLELVGVVEIDPELSETAASQEAYELPPASLANCVIVGGKRGGTDRLAACVVLSTTRADVNGVVRRRLDVRKASFLPMDDAVTLTGMEYGAINPIGLPPTWPILIDRRVVETDVVLLGSGVRRSKLLAPGALLGELPAAEVLDQLGAPRSTSASSRPEPG